LADSRGHLNSPDKTLREKIKKLPGGSFDPIRSSWKAGAGDGIRTHDFNLGKVALYP
jgi:hypothetical protein